MIPTDLKRKAETYIDGVNIRSMAQLTSIALQEWIKKQEQNE